jgi:uncharacterized protein with PQ loop repeat
MIQTLGLIGAVILPFWNIPLMVRIQKRRSSDDISLAWALGVWVCLLAMFPSGFMSQDTVYRVFTIINMVLFTGVVVQVVRFR